MRLFLRGANIVYAGRGLVASLQWIGSVALGVNAAHQAARRSFVDSSSPRATMTIRSQPETGYAS